MASVRNTVLFDAFDANAESFDSYLERLQAYFQAMEIGQCDADATAAVREAADKKKVVHLISCIGRETYGTLRDLCLPNRPMDKKFDELCQCLGNHFKPKKLEIAETYRFHQCVQQLDESISVYSARLRRMAATCNFGDNLTRALRDQFVTGIRYAETRKKLLGKDNSFDEVMKIALADEAAVRETSQLASSVNSVQSRVHKVQKTVAKGRQQPVFQKPVFQNSANSTHPKNSLPGHSHQFTGYICRSCGKGNHRRADCRFRDATCHRCSRKGHISSVCQSLSTRGTVHNIDQFENVDEDTPNVPEVSDQLFTVNEQSEPVCYSPTGRGVEIQLTIENQDAVFQLDTGCGRSIVPKNFYDKYLSHLFLQPTDVVLETYTKEILRPLGTVNVEVVYEQVTYKLPLLVTECGNCPLFGRNWLNVIKLNWPSLLANVHSVSSMSADSASVAATSINRF